MIILGGFQERLGYWSQLNCEPEWRHIEHIHRSQFRFLKSAVKKNRGKIQPHDEKMVAPPLTAGFESGLKSPPQVLYVYVQHKNLESQV